MIPFVLLFPKFVFDEVSDKRRIKGTSDLGFAVSPNLVDAINIKNVNRRSVSVRIEVHNDFGFRMKPGLFKSFELRDYPASQRIVAREIEH
jgi:hypothetical protein